MGTTTDWLNHLSCGNRHGHSFHMFNSFFGIILNRQISLYLFYNYLNYLCLGHTCTLTFIFSKTAFGMNLVIPTSFLNCKSQTNKIDHTDVQDMEMVANIRSTVQWNPENSNPQRESKRFKLSGVWVRGKISKEMT